jgi:hypothetical protein
MLSQCDKHDEGGLKGMLSRPISGSVHQTDRTPDRIIWCTQLILAAPLDGASSSYGIGSFILQRHKSA